MAKGRILAIDSDQPSRDLYQKVLPREGYYLRLAETVEDGIQALGEEPFDLVLAGLSTSDPRGISLIEAIRRQNDQQEILLILPENAAALGLHALKRGVPERLPRPFDGEALLLSINRLLYRQSVNREHARLLDENIQFLSQLGCYQRCLEFLKVRDPERLAALILDTLMELLKAEGGTLWLGRGEDEPGGWRPFCRRGLAAAGAEVRLPGSRLPALRAANGPLFAEEGRVLCAPVVVDSELAAVLRIDAPVGRPDFKPQDALLMKTVADYAAAALHPVLTERQLEQSLLRASHGHAYNMTFFRDHAAKEIYKAKRYGRHLSLVLLRIENYPELSSRFLGRDVDQAIVRLLEGAAEVLRDSDIIAQAAADSYLILLPETDYWGALVTQKRIRQALRGRLMLSDLKKSLSLKVLMRAAACPADGLALDELVATAEGRLDEVRRSLMGEGKLQQQPFWEGVTSLLGAPSAYRLGDKGEFTLAPSLAARQRGVEGSYFRMPQGRLDEIMRAFCTEVAETPTVRGLLYRGCGDFTAVRGALYNEEALEQSATSFFLLGGKKRVRWEAQRLLPIYIDEPLFTQTPFLLYLNEVYAYALFARRHQGELIGFHTCDFYFVENMIAKLQEEYRLQAQI